MQLLIVIDDEKGPMTFYLTALTRSFEVMHLKGPDEAIAYVSDQSKPVPVAVVLDAMLPPGQKYVNNPDAKRGLRTGILLYEEVLRANWPEVPVIVLSNSTAANNEIKEKYPHLPVYEKIDVTPLDLVKIVQEIVKIRQSELRAKAQT